MMAIKMHWLVYLWNTERWVVCFDIGVAFGFTLHLHLCFYLIDWLLVWFDWKSFALDRTLHVHLCVLFASWNTVREYFVFGFWRYNYKEHEFFEVGKFIMSYFWFGLNTEAFAYSLCINTSPQSKHKKPFSS